MKLLAICLLFSLQFAFAQDADTEIPFAPEPEVATAPSSTASESEPGDYYEGTSSYAKNKEGFWNKYTYAAAGLAGAGLISVVYGVLQHQLFNDRLKQMQAIQNDPRYAQYSTPNPVFHPVTGQIVPGDQVKFQSLGNKSFHDLSKEKEGAEMNRNIGLVLGALCIGGSVVLFTF